MERFQPPPSLELSGNVADQWKKFEQRFALYVEAIGKTDASDKTKNAILLTVAGDEALDVYNTFKSTQKDKVLSTAGAVTEVNKPTSVLKRFSDYCSTRV